MKEITATEQIFSPLGHQTGVKYHYADGTFTELTYPVRTREQEEKRKSAMDRVNEIIKKWDKK